MIISNRDDGLMVMQLPNKKVIVFNRGDIWESGIVRQDVYVGKTLYERRMHKPDKSKIRCYWAKLDLDRLRSNNKQLTEDHDVWRNRWLELEVINKGLREDLEQMSREYYYFAMEQLSPLSLSQEMWQERLETEYPVLKDLLCEEEE